ncbi:hypothetical protein, partial [Mycolicibacterium diernhoferi]|uniref:hypothetical protein n=1 Tax=Mycolicibacterium diernhoferi TaxID=1801 RepID=UPI0039881809
MLAEVPAGSGPEYSPHRRRVQAQVLLASKADVDTAVASAVEAQKVWAAYNPQ